MTPADAEAFNSEVQMVAAGLREKVSAEQIGALFLALLPYDFDEVRQALRRALIECTWFPVPSGIIALIHENRARVRALGAAERQRALPPGPKHEKEGERVREEALAAIRKITADIAGRMTPPPPPPALRSVEAMNAEVERLRVLEGKKPLRVIDGGKKE